MKVVEVVGLIYCRFECQKSRIGVLDARRFQNENIQEKKKIFFSFPHLPKNIFRPFVNIYANDNDSLWGHLPKSKCPKPGS